MMVLKAQGVYHIPVFCLLPLLLPPLLPLPLSQSSARTPFPGETLSFSVMLSEHLRSAQAI